MTSNFASGENGYFARAQLFGQEIHTAVDSRIAKYYLEHYLQGERTNPDLHAVIDRIHQEMDNSPMTRDLLKKLSDKTSPDFATLYFAQRTSQDSSNWKVQCTFQTEFRRLKNSKTENRLRSSPTNSKYIILFAPGWLYKLNSEIGADLGGPRKLLSAQGFETHLIETDENGTIEDNAHAIANEIRLYKDSKRQLIIVSASKGGPEVAYALGNLLPRDDADHVKAWVNIGGIIQGSLLADFALSWPKSLFFRIVFAFKGLSTTGVESITTQRSRERFRTLDIPEGLFILNYTAVPLSGHITKGAQDGYEDLREHGPNDGLTLLADEIVPRGVTVMELGLDHYYLDPDIDLKAVALAKTVINLLERQYTTHDKHITN